MLKRRIRRVLAAEAEAEREQASRGPANLNDESLVEAPSRRPQPAASARDGPRLKRESMPPARTAAAYDLDEEMGD